MKHKIWDLLEPRLPNDTAYANVIRELPEIITKEDKSKAKMGEGASSLEINIATSIRQSSLPMLRSYAENARKRIEGDDQPHDGREEDEEDEREVEGEEIQDGENADDSEDEPFADEDAAEDTGGESEEDAEDEVEIEGMEEEEEEDQEIKVPLSTLDSMIDPRLMACSIALERVEGNTRLNDSVPDPMDIDRGGAS